MEHNYRALIAGNTLHFRFRFEGNTAPPADYFTPEIYDGEAITVEDRDFKLWENLFSTEWDSRTEYGLSVFRAGDALLKYNCCGFHSAAFVWRGKAYLFTAPSGTGKSTQLKNWMNLYGDETQILNGDKPVMKLCEDGQVLVCPSPWKGKEGWGNDEITAPLGGIICLTQGKENKVGRMQVRSAISPLLKTFLFTFETEETILAACAIEQGMLNQAPVWHLVNLGDEASTALIHDAILKEEGL